ncbi:MAG: hypothetical protein ACI4SF_05155 [Oscillospiraceae bacterium]
MDYEITKRIKFKEKYMVSSSFEKEEDVSSYIYIVKLGNKYGIFSDDNEELVPCEYDNITFLNFEIFQLVKKGKIGIAHIEELDDEYSSQRLKRLIPCEYDSLDYSKSKATVALKKDEFEGQKCRVYFPMSDMLTDQYDSYEILGRGLIELCNSNGSELFDLLKGK